MGPGSGWVQVQGGSRFRVGPGSGWVQVQGGSRTRVNADPEPSPTRNVSLLRNSKEPSTIHDIASKGTKSTDSVTRTSVHSEGAGAPGV